MNVLVVSSYTPIRVKHLSEEDYRRLGSQLVAAVAPYPIRIFENPIEDYWLSSEPGLPKTPATPMPEDRYWTVEDNIKINVLMHNRTEWAVRGAAEYPEAEVIVYLDFGIMKQGHWCGNPISSDHVRAFLDRVSRYPFEKSMPFPGILGKQPVNPRGNNWRFCGSTHIWPIKWLPAIDRVYKKCVRDFIRDHECLPIDLPIWPEVEERCSRPGPNFVPFQWYSAEYDARQLTAFPDSEDP